MNELGFLLIVLIGVGAVAFGSGVLTSNNENEYTVPVSNQYTIGGRRKTKSNRKKSIKRHKK